MLPITPKKEKKKKKKMMFIIIKRKIFIPRKNAVKQPGRFFCSWFSCMFVS
jgi:hypothetical protein